MNLETENADEAQHEDSPVWELSTCCSAGVEVRNGITICLLCGKGCKTYSPKDALNEYFEMLRSIYGA